ncbi:MAG TPA: GNAT family N-acetyltransferase [Jiangellaceae bacterium]
MDDFDRYLSSLVGSWELAAVPHPDAVVIRGKGFIAARFPYPVLNNAVLTDLSTLDAVRAVYRGAEYAVWTELADRHLADVMQAGGFRRDVTTRPMLCHLAEAELDDVDSGTVLADVDPDRIAALNGVTTDLVRGVPGLRAYATVGFESGLVVLPVGTDVNVSFVATQPDARRRGLAELVTRTALRDARDRGFVTASLQATPMAESIYARVGFRPVGHWQEWVPA